MNKNLLHPYFSIDTFYKALTGGSLTEKNLAGQYCYDDSNTHIGGGGGRLNGGN